MGWVAEPRTVQGGSIHELVSGRQLAARLFRLARGQATGILSIARPAAKAHTLILDRGLLVVSTRAESSDLGRDHSGHARSIGKKLRRLAGEPSLRLRFDGGVRATPPGSSCKRVALDAWILGYLESSLTRSRAAQLTSELAGQRISVRESLAPLPAHLDETGRRLVAALTCPIRIDQLATAARAPRFRTLAFVFALRELGALRQTGVGAIRSVPSKRLKAERLLGLDDFSDQNDVKRAYHRIARALHPDMHPVATDVERRRLESKLADVNRAYRQLLRATGRQ